MTFINNNRNKNNINRNKNNNNNNNKNRNHNNNRNNLDNLNKRMMREWSNTMGMGRAPIVLVKNLFIIAPHFCLFFVGSLNERLGSANLGPIFQVYFYLSPSFIIIFRCF